MGKVMTWLAVMAIGVGISLQEMACAKRFFSVRVAPKLARVEKLVARESRVVKGVMPSFEKVLDERRSEFNAVVFGEVAEDSAPRPESRLQPAPVISASATVAQPGNQPVHSYKNQTQVEGMGEVVLVLTHDPTDSRRQKFVARLDSGKTLLIVHDTEVAPRVENLQLGDTIAFCGEYTVGQSGEALIRTHRDPSGRHAAGWLKHQGKVYQ